MIMMYIIIIPENISYLKAWRYRLKDIGKTISVQNIYYMWESNPIRQIEEIILSERHENKEVHGR